MRKIIFAIAAVLISVTAFAQKGIPRSNNVSVSSTVITEKKVKKERVLPPYKHGFHEYVELGTKVASDDLRGGTGINYIGGYRFNRHFFAGVGIGVEFAHYVGHEIKANIGASAKAYSKNGLSSYNTRGTNILGGLFGIQNYFGNRSINLISIPLYLQLRGYYYTGTKCSLYSSLSFGGMFAPKDSGIYADLSFGADIKINDKTSIYLSAGFWYKRCRDNSSYHLWYDEYLREESCGDLACRYNDYHEESHYHYYVSDLFTQMTSAYGLSIRIGVPIHLIGQIFDKTKK